MSVKTETITTVHLLTIHTPSGEIVSDERFTDATPVEVKEIAAERDQYDDIHREITLTTTTTTTTIDQCTTTVFSL